MTPGLEWLTSHSPLFENKMIPEILISIMLIMIFIIEVQKKMD